MATHIPSSLNTLDPLELLHAIPHPIAILDHKLKILAMNHFLEAMTGFITEEVAGVQSDFILRTNFSMRNSPFSRTLATGEQITVDGNILTTQHNKIPIRFTISELTSLEEKGLMVVMEDISLEKDTTREHLPYVGGVEILGHSPQMQEIFELIPVLAQTDASVLITGETGTGKDKIAEIIHKTSKRVHHPFVKINCGALPESLLESELFGHVRGAFTGAIHDKPGMFKLAHGGTIFLTEIGDLPLPLQIKLLSVLDDHEFFPVGASKKTSVDVRIIAATHRSLQDHVQRGLFREDLFYRLNVLRLHLPALRDREGDIHLLTDHFLNKFDTRLNKGSRTFSDKTARILETYHYPGNVRELRNIVEYAANICHDKTITPDCLPKYIFKPLFQSLPQRETPYLAPPPTAQLTDAKEGVTKSGSWKEIEKEMILNALKKSGGKRMEACRMLGWGRTTLWRKIKRYGLG